MLQNQFSTEQNITRKQNDNQILELKAEALDAKLAGERAFRQREEDLLDKIE